MTIQVQNYFIYYSDLKAIVGRSSEEHIFAPYRDLGVRPKSASSACWRGYISIFSIIDGKLNLDYLCLNVDAPININKKDPSQDRAEIFKSNNNLEFVSGDFKYFYSNIGLEISFSGSILIETEEGPSNAYLFNWARKVSIMGLDMIKQDVEKILTDHGLSDGVSRLSNVTSQEELASLLDEWEEKVYSGMRKLIFKEGVFISESDLSIKDYKAEKYYTIYHDYRTQ